MGASKYVKNGRFISCMTVLIQFPERKQLDSCLNFGIYWNNFLIFTTVNWITFVNLNMCEISY